MSEVDDLLNKAQVNLGVAKKLLELGEYENAVSRAYYCIFYAAKVPSPLKTSFQEPMKELSESLW